MSVKGDELVPISTVPNFQLAIQTRGDDLENYWTDIQIALLGTYSWFISGTEFNPIDPVRVEQFEPEPLLFVDVCKAGEGGDGEHVSTGKKIDRLHRVVRLFLLLHFDLSHRFERSVFHRNRFDLALRRPDETKRFVRTGLHANGLIELALDS